MVSKKDKQTHGKELEEQLLAELIEAMEENKKTLPYKISKVMWAIIGWGVGLAALLGVYRLLEWLITM